MKRIIYLLLFTCSLLTFNTSEIYASVEKNNQFGTKAISENNDKKISDSTFDSLTIPSVYYCTHIENFGWDVFVKDGNTSGKINNNKRIEAIQIKLNTNNSLVNGISYSAHVQNVGWQSWKEDGKISGTTGEEKRLEAIKIKLTGEIVNYYDVYYRVYVQDNGWMSWAKNGNAAGTAGYGYRLEGIQVVLVKKDAQPPGDTETPFIQKSNTIVSYSTHIQNIGWQDWKENGQMSGTSGQAKRLEAIRITLENVNYSGKILYRTHIQNVGWQDWKENGQISGTTSQEKRLEAIQIKLIDDINNYYDIYYRVHVENYGWMSWAKNGEKSGTEGCGKRLEAIEIKLVDKNSYFPGDIDRPFIGMGNINYSTSIEKKGWLAEVGNGESSGLANGKIIGIKISLGDNEYNGNIEYSTHIEGHGWNDYVSNGEICGIENESKRIEAIKIKLSGEIANHYDVYYRVKCQNFGWLDWTCNDRISGTVGGSFKVEEVQIKLYPKLATKPVLTNRGSLVFQLKNSLLVCYDGLGYLQEDSQGLLGLMDSYLLRVNKSTNVVTVVIKDGTGKYNIAYKRFICSTGIDTPIGTFYTPAKYRWKELMGASYGQYSTRIVGGILFHSVPYNQKNSYTLSPRMYNQLGTTCSHGCVRLTCADAKWIYDNCKLKTRVDIIENKLDPLSKPKVQKLPMNQTWDPTDPNI